MGIDLGLEGLEFRRAHPLLLGFYGLQQFTDLAAHFLCVCRQAADLIRPHRGKRFAKFSVLHILDVRLNPADLAQLIISQAS